MTFDQSDPVLQAKRRQCDFCGAGFLRGRADHRFCSIPCKDQFHVAERRKAVALLRKRQALSSEEQCVLENEEIARANRWPKDWELSSGNPSSTEGPEVGQVEIVLERRRA